MYKEIIITIIITIIALYFLYKNIKRKISGKCDCDDCSKCSYKCSSKDESNTKK